MKTVVPRGLDSRTREPSESYSYWIERGDNEADDGAACRRVKKSTATSRPSTSYAIARPGEKIMLPSRSHENVSLPALRGACGFIAAADASGYVYGPTSNFHV